MKASHTRFLIPALAGAVLASALSGCKTAGDFYTATATGPQAAEVRGAVRITDATKQWRTLRAGQAVATDNLIQTALESAADIFVPGNGGANVRVLMQSDTVLAVQALPGSGANDLRLDLRMGWLTITSTPDPESPVCEIKCAHGLVGARSATFTVTADGRVKVMTGTVVVKPLGDQPAKSLSAGMQYEPQSAQISAAPAGSTTQPPAPPLPTPPPPPRPNRPGTNPFPWIERPR